MTLVLGVRHGKVHNPRNVIYAGLDGYGLSELGRAQAERVAGALRGARIKAIYASPLQRAVETASAIADATGVEIATDDRLTEWGYWTRWAGRTWDDLRATSPESWDAYRDDPGSLTEGESLTELADRMESWLQDAVAACPDGLVVAVTHLEPLRAALLRLTGMPWTDLLSVRIGEGQTVRLHPDPSRQVLDREALHFPT